MKKLMGTRTTSSKTVRLHAGFFSRRPDIFESFEFTIRLIAGQAGLLYLVSEKFANIDLHPDVVSNAQMGQFSRN